METVFTVWVITEHANVEEIQEKKTIGVSVDHFYSSIYFENEKHHNDTHSELFPLEKLSYYKLSDTSHVTFNSGA